MAAGVPKPAGISPPDASTILDAPEGPHRYSCMHPISDPRTFPLSGLDHPRPDWRAWTEDSLGAATSDVRQAAEERLVAEVASALEARQLDLIRTVLDAAPSAAHYRHMWRALIAAWRSTAVRGESGVGAFGFALPVILVAAADANRVLPGILTDAAEVIGVLQQHGGLGGNRNFGIANVLAGPDVVGLGGMQDWLKLDHGIPGESVLHDIEPSSVAVAGGSEGAHLRFLVGVAIAAPHAPLFDGGVMGGWGMPLARCLSRQLGVDGVQVLALPRPPADPITAYQQGRAAQREVALELFASSAIRKLRAAFGEPTAVLSAHRIDGAGELRLSLSSPLGERDAEGFRCPLHPTDRLEDVLRLMVDLLRACRVADIRVKAGVYADRDPQTGLALLFRGDATGTADAACH
jgi:hypothetical protein